MAINTNLNVAPYWDDYDPENDFYKVLFRPGYAVQARELTTLQSILQNQVEQFGNHIFKEGTIVIPGSVGYDKKYYALNLEATHKENALSTYLSEFVGSTITGETSGVTATVIGYDTVDFTTGDPDTLYVKYISSSEIDNSTITFTEGESIRADRIIAGGEPNAEGVYPSIATALQTGANETGSAVTVLEGVYFIRGFMVRNSEQTIVLDKYSDTPSYRVGWLIDETFVNPEDDGSLLDNAQGSSNYAAKGAHRLKMDLVLIKKSIDNVDDDDFVELIRVEEGIVQNKVKHTEYNVVAEMIARRTSEESGDYIVKHFDMEVRENLNNGVNRGVFKAEDGGREDKETIVISPGKAYVDGYEVDLQATSYVELNKAREVKNIQNSHVPTPLGQYVKVTNVYGQPDISENGSMISPFAVVKLYDSQTETPGLAPLSGKHIGYARSKAFEYDSGFVGDPTSIYNHFLFDITMFNIIEMSDACTLTENALITGNSSGATAIVVNSISGETEFKVMQQTGIFVRDETFYSSVSSDITAGTILPETNYEGNKKAFGRDVKQLNMDKPNGLDYTADIYLSDSITTFAAADGTRSDSFDPAEWWANSISSATARLNSLNLGPINILGDIITGLGTEFFLDIVPGDVISFSVPDESGTSVVQEVATVSEVISQGTLKLVEPLSTGDMDNILATRMRTTIFENGRDTLIYKLPKGNVKTLLNSSGFVDTNYSFRKQYLATSVAGGIATFKLPAGQSWDSLSDEKNYVLSVLSSGTGTAATGSIVDIAGKAVISGDGLTLTITDSVVLGSGTSLELMGTANLSVSKHREKKLNSMVTKEVGKDSLEDVYGERVFDKTISLSYADVTAVHAIYESIDDATDAVSPTLTIDHEVGDLQPGDYITGSVSRATGRVISVLGNIVNYVKLYSQITTLDIVSAEGSDAQASVIQTTPGDKNISSSFALDTGQRESIYDIGRIVRGPRAQRPSGKLLIVYDYFTHSHGDYCSVDSYTGQIAYEDIPFFSGGTGPDAGIYWLNDCLDFRPRVADQENPTSCPFAYLNKSFTADGSVIGNLSTSSGSISTDFDFYMSRKDLLYLDKLGYWSIVEGVASETPVYPATDNMNMLVGRVDIPAYTFNTEDVSLKYMNNKGFKMRDISKLESRIANLEYSTTLGLLERETESYQILDADGIDRFKSGFVVDNFYGHGVGNSHHPDYEIAVDPSKGHIRPIGFQTGVNLIEEATTDSDRDTLGYQKTGDLITLKYSEVNEIYQPWASRVESVNPYFVTNWIGNLTLSPDSDIWMDDDRLPAITINIEGNYDQMMEEYTESGALGTVWDSWNTTWTGNPTSSTSSSSSSSSSNWVERNPNGSGAQRNLIRQVSSTDWSTTTTTTSTLDVDQERTGIETRLVERIDTQSAGDKVVNVEVVPWIRSRDVNFICSGMKPNTKVYCFFDGIDVNADVKPLGGNASSANSTANFINSDVILSVDSTEGFLTKGTLGIGDALELDPWGIGYIKQEQMTYTGKTATTFTGITRNTGNQFDEPQNWLAGTPVTDQTYGNPIITSDDGILEGRFKIPNTDIKRFRVGNRIMRLTDSSVDSRVGGFSYTTAEKVYFASGHKQTKQETIMAVRNSELAQTATFGTQSFTSTTTSSSTTGGGNTDRGGWYDPLAQSIMVDKSGGMFVTSVDLFFSHRDEKLPCWMEIRTMVNGYPSSTILPFSVKYLSAEEININPEDGTTPTTFTFDSPVYLTGGTEYCIVVASDSPEYRVWISRLGEMDIGGTASITTQPHLGSLFKSQNASTWTPSQYEDLKFTLKRAKFETGTPGLFTVVNEEFTESELSAGGGNGLIPNLRDNPIETVEGINKVKVLFPNHNNHDVLNNVEVRGVISDINPTKLDGSIPADSITIECFDTSNFPTNGIVKIENELIEYTGKSGDSLLNCIRGSKNSDNLMTPISIHQDGVLVNLYMFGGIPLTEINKVHDRIENPELDSFLLATDTVAVVTTSGGGTNVLATKNVSYDVVQPLMQTMEFANTSLTASLQPTSGTTVGNISQISFNQPAASIGLPVPLNQDTYFNSPNIICSPVNERTNLLGRKSFRLNTRLSTELDHLSPVIDTARMVAICVGSRLNDIDSVDDVNVEFTKYYPSTKAMGDNNSSIYILKKISLAETATSLKVYVDFVKMVGTKIKVLYKIQQVDSTELFDDLDWVPFVGESGEPDGLSDPSVTPSKNETNFKEHQYMAGKKTNGTGAPLKEFNAFAIKIVMQGDNSSTPPIGKDFRAIALAR